MAASRNSIAGAQPGTCRFAFSADVSALVRCRVDRVLPKSLAEELVGDEPLDLEVDLVLDGQVFRTLRSGQAVFDASPEQGAFRPQQFVFAIKVKDMPRSSSLVLRLRCGGRSFRGTLPLFSKRAALMQGRQVIALLPDGKAVQKLNYPSLLGVDFSNVQCQGQDEQSSALQLTAGASIWEGRGPLPLKEALRLMQAGEMLARGWLPPAAPGLEGAKDFFASSAHEAIEASGLPWLCVCLPVFAHPVVFAEPIYGQEIEVPSTVLVASLPDELSAADLEDLSSCSWLLRPLRTADEAPAVRLKAFRCFVDHDASNEHPALLKSLRLARSSRARGSSDREARPNAEELRRLNELIRRPRRHFSTEEKHLLFRFRWSLTDQPGALPKFLHAVDWSDMEERQHAIELLGHWSPVAIDDAMELLSKDFAGAAEVRRHAVKRLEQAADEDLQLYLLQLVQALRYEPVEGEVPGTKASNTPVVVEQPGPLTGFLIRRSVGCRTLATLFHWYVVAEMDDRERGADFDRVRRHLLDALAKSADGRATLRMLERQVALRMKLLFCVRFAKESKRERIEKKIERFRQALASNEPPPADGPGRGGSILSVGAPCHLELVGGLEEGIPLPVDPSVSLVRVLANQSFVLKSAMNPGVLTCEVRPSGMPSGELTLKKIMIKEGDDLRQDQLVLQLIVLMDSILKKYGLDLCLTPYQVIALSNNDGIIEFVPDASNLSTVLKDHNSDIQQFFRAHHPRQTIAGESAELQTGAYGPHNSYGIEPKVLDNFVRSSAGYCVITYILGIGDRHLDNLMVTRDGRLFHIDFGFILGKDPKPFSAPMRICKEMVEGMGGNNSPGHQAFQSQCCQAYKILRRHSKLILNLLYLMTDSGIKDLCGDPMFAILKVEQKFQGDMDDEQAEEHLRHLIDESVNAIMPRVMEGFHRVAIAMQ